MLDPCLGDFSRLPPQAGADLGQQPVKFLPQSVELSQCGPALSEDAPFSIGHGELFAQGLIVGQRILHERAKGSQAQPQHQTADPSET